MKPASCLVFLSCLVYSCTDNSRVENGRSILNNLVPYAQRYPGTGAKDTTLPGNMYLKYLVRADTADGVLYISYGRPGLEKIYRQSDGAPFNCNTWEYAYHTPQTIGLMYECASGRELLVLPLNDSDSVHIYTPLFVGVEDSLLLVEDNRKRVNGLPSLMAADLDFKQQKTFQLSFDIPCPDMLACFDTIYFNKKLVMEYETGEEGQEPVTRMQAEALDWKNK